MSSRQIRLVLIVAVTAIALTLLYLANDHDLRSPFSAKHNYDADSRESTVAAPEADAFVDETGRIRKFVPNQVLVHFRDPATEIQVDGIIARLDATVIKTFRPPGKLYQLSLPSGMTADQALQQLAEISEVESAEPNYIYYKDVIPDDPIFDRLWGLQNTEIDVDINAPEAWDISTGSADVYIGVIDTGIDYLHEDLIANVWTNPGEIPGNGIDDDQNGWVDDVHGYDMAYDDSDPRDDEGHGSHVSGIIAAAGNNGIGSTGVMWRASIISCKFLDSNGYGTTAGAVGCLDYFSDLKNSGIDIIATNNSWGSAPFSAILSDAIAAHRDQDILFVAAAGNDGVDTDSSPHYPSSYDLSNIVSVAALDNRGRLAEFSNFGLTTVDIAAPGVAIWSTLPGNNYDVAQGTSMAAPHVTGVIGLIRSADPLLTGAEIQAWLLSHGTETGELSSKVNTGAFLRATLPPTDKDEDGMPDQWEQQFGLNPLDAADALLDADSDGLNNLDEYLRGTNPLDPDTDGDGLSDGDEVNVHGTDPTSADTDEDGLSDFDEINQYGTNPGDADTDGDGLTDREEIITYATNPLSTDSDGDGLTDGWEVEFGFDPLQAGEQNQDPDGDGLDNAGEFLAGTDPFIIDTDNDGLLDGDELNIYGTDPTLEDTDGDGMLDEWEIRYGLDPLANGDASPDPDGDGFSNFEEFLGGTDPGNPQAIPPHRPWSNLNGDSRQSAHAPIVTVATTFDVAWQMTADDYRPASLAISKWHVGLFRQPGADILVEGIDLITGDINWTRSLPQVQFVSGLRALKDEIAVYGEPRQSIAASLWALDTQTGTPTKSIPIGENRPGVTAVTTDGNTFIARIGNDLVNIDTITGQAIWRTPLINAGLQRLSIPPAVNASYVVATAGNAAFVYDRMSGALLYEISVSQCASVSENTVMIDSDNRAFITGSKCIWAIDLDTQQILWENDQDYSTVRPSMDQTLLYVISGSRLQAIDKETGATAWQWLEDLALGSNIVTSLSHVFVESWGGIFAINKLTQIAEWSHPVYGRMAISDEGILIVESRRDSGFTAINISADTDNDGLPDNWEKRYKLNHLDPNDAGRDSDNDGLTNIEEFNAGSNPKRRDSDSDGLSDFDEIWIFETDPGDADSDDDGLSDGDEVLIFGSNPTFADTDRDGIIDGVEVHEYGSDPTDRSSIPPLIFDYQESFEAGMPAGWTTPLFAQAEWSVQNGPATDGVFSLSTADVPTGLTAVIEWTGSFAAGDLYYDAMVSQGAGVAPIEVYLDGVRSENISNFAWERKGARIPKGQHTIQFVFRNSDPDARTALIDNIEFRVPRPLAANPNNVIVLANEHIWEFDLQGNATRLPIRMPRTDRDFEIAVDHKHRIVVGDGPYLHFYEPITRRFSKKFIGQWHGVRFVAYSDGFILSNPSGAAAGLILLDLDANYVGHVARGTGYVDLDIGLDGYLYALQAAADPFVDQIDLASFSVVRTFPVTQAAREVAADAEGSVFVYVFRETFLKYDANGSLVKTLQENTGNWAHGPQITSNGVLLFGSRVPEFLVSSTELDSIVRFPITAPSFEAGNGDTYVAAIRTTGIDSDMDGIPDWWEYGEDYDPFDPADATVDVDGDGLDALNEYLNQTDPNVADTDGDGLNDGVEVNTYGSNPLQIDSDGDLISDFEEVTTYLTDPNRADTDMDGLSDWEEIFSTNSDPSNADTDGDGMSDGWEFDNGLDMLGASDAALDPDADGLSNLEEFNNGTDILDADTDGDSLSDGEEVNVYLTFPLLKDSDNDWLHDGWEILFGYNPLLEGEEVLDTDADGFTNLDEFYSGTDPTDAALRPVARSWTMHQGNSAHTGHVPLKIDPARYQQIWTNLSLAGAVSITPATVDGGIVSVTVKDELGSQFLHALDASDGSVVWSVDFSTIETLSSPTAIEGALFVQSSDTATDTGAMHKFDAATGNLVFETPYSVRNPRLLAPTEFAGNLYAFGGLSKGVASFRTDVPIITWSTPALLGLNWAVAVDNSSIYAMAVDNLTVLNRTTGVVDYVIAYPEGLLNYVGDNSTIVDRFARVYVVINNELVAFDTESRTVDWSINTGNFEGFASFLSGMLYAVESGGIVAIDSRDGSEKWRWDGPDAIKSSIIVTLDHIFVSSFSETFALNRDTGLEVWRTPGGGEITMDEFGTLYVSGYNGEIAAYGLSVDRDGDGIPDDWEDFYGLNADDPTDALIDTDSDGLSNLDEFRAGTDPTSADTDGDGLSDLSELQQHLTDPNLADTDGDGLDDSVELNNTLTDPNNPDTDGDRVSDGDEVNLHFTDPFVADTDGDGIGDFEEVQTGSDPLNMFSTPQVLGAMSESFEDGVLPLGWSLPIGSDFGWQVTTGDAYDGTHRLESDVLTFPSMATIEFTGNFPAGYIDYYTIARADGCCAEVSLYIGDRLMRRDTGSSWGLNRLGVSPGILTLRWEFIVSNLDPRMSRTGLLDWFSIVPDRDGDGMPDAWEELYGLDPDDWADVSDDLDFDGVSNGAEFGFGTSPIDADTDGDGMSDGFEIQFQLDPTDPSDAAGDPDGDGLDNVTEAGLQTSPRNTDSDGDGMPDPYEVANGLDPASSSDRLLDADGDGLTNIDEFLVGTSPNNPDSDSDTLPDGWEVGFGLNPLDASDANGDLDNDGLDNSAEFGLGTSPISSDTDGDGMPDKWEVDNNLDPLVNDAAGDPDRDGVSNLAEYNAGTDPHAAPPPTPPPIAPPPKSNSGGGGSGPFLMMGLLWLLARRRLKVWRRSAPKIPRFPVVKLTFRISRRLRHGTLAYRPHVRAPAAHENAFLLDR